MCCVFQFAADYTEKTLFKTIMVRLLRAALAGAELDLAALLNDEILNVDQQLLRVERSTGEISGEPAANVFFTQTCMIAKKLSPPGDVIRNYVRNDVSQAFAGRLGVSG